MSKTRRRILGISIVIIGILMIIYTGLKYAGIEGAVDTAMFGMNAEKSYPLVWSAIVGVVLFVTGIGVLTTGKLKG